MTTHKEALTLALEALKPRAGMPEPEYESLVNCAITAIKEALAQPEQPKVRTGDCLLTGVCASEGHKIQLKEPEQEPVAHFGSAYINENGVHITTVLGPVAIPQDANLYTTPPQRKPLEPVEGDLLPTLGSKVLIHLARQDEWVEHTVVGYYVWGDLDGLDKRMHRVFVRVVDADGILNSRMLRDVRQVEAAHGIKE